MLNRIIILLLLAGFVSCTADAPEEPGGTTIGFGIDLMQSKGTLVTQSQEVKTMGMFSIYTKDRFPNSDAHIQMENIQVYRTSVNGSFTYSPISYWPNDGYLSFMAYSPFATPQNGISAALINKENVQITYINSTTLASQSDLMVAEKTNMAGLPPGTTAAPEVNLPFRHILSAVEFKGKYKTNYAAQVVKIRQITLSGFYGSGTYLIGTQPQWTLAGTATSAYNMNQDNGLRDLVLTTADQPLMNTGSALMLIPQQMPADGWPMDITIEVTDNGKITTTTEQTRFKINSPLAEGKKYMVAIVYEVADSEAKISLSYEVVNWEIKNADLPEFN
ncbi:MAG: fimbrillin family protein [Bacteroidales bacterium]